MADQAFERRFTMALGEMSMAFAVLETQVTKGIIFLESRSDILGGITATFRLRFSEKLKRLGSAYQAAVLDPLKMDLFTQWSRVAEKLAHERNAFLHSFYWSTPSDMQHVTRFDVAEKGRHPNDLAKTNVTFEMVEQLTVLIQRQRDSLAARFVNDFPKDPTKDPSPPFNAFTNEFHKVMKT